jgi:capsular exopolysaccharide synthesis family protein
VALVDADLRRPMIHSFLGLSDKRGLVDVLAGTAELPDVTQLVEEGRIGVIAAGPVPANPSELTGSEKMLRTLQELEHQYDVVIIDSPPVLPVADALVLAVNVQAVVLVTRVGETTREKLRRTKDSLTNVHANLVGVVPNGAVQGEDSAYAYAYRYRSRRKPLKGPYSPREPEVDPRPDNLVPARRANHAAVGGPAARPGDSPTDESNGDRPAGNHFKESNQSSPSSNGWGEAPRFETSEPGQAASGPR